MVQSKKIGNKLAHALIDLIEHVDRGGIHGVVEIKEPGFSLAEQSGCRWSCGYRGIGAIHALLVKLRKAGFKPICIEGVTLPLKILTQRPNRAIHTGQMALDTTTAATPATKGERDRFVAFAFCWADVLIELDAESRIAFAAGATEILAGRNAGQLIGSDFLEFVADRDRPLMRELLKVAEKRGRIENVIIRLAGTLGTSPPLSLAGYRLEDLSGHYFLALRAASSAAQRVPGAGRDPGSGLFDPNAFSRVATERLRQAKEAGEDAELTLIMLPEFEDLRERLDEEAEQSLITTLGATLRANSLNGDSAAQVGDGRYALVHEGGIDVADLETEISAVTKELDPEGKGVAAETATLEVDDVQIDDEDLANGLVYAINRFRDARGQDFNIKDFSSNLSDMVGEAVQSVHAFNVVLEKSEFDVAFHPILDVETGEIHHFEALARFDKDGANSSPYETITFAEEIGLIWRFDIAMARKVVEWLSQSGHKHHSVAVNISGHSISQPDYLKELQDLLARNFWVKGQLLFEITESARIADLTIANHFIQTLRSDGYPVCLDDFGAGAASFQYLSTLEVDVVKLDGSAVKNAQRARKGKAFLSALARLCHDLNVETIAEMVDEREGLDFIRACGIDYAQGYLFGEPSRQVEVFDISTLANLFPGIK